MCTCPQGMTGNPFVYCRPFEGEFLSDSRKYSVSALVLLNSTRLPEPPKTNPCIPSPCGPNSQCRERNDQAICSCLPSFVGAPPQCRPECVSNSECPPNEACVNQHCIDPCPGTCGVGARCVVNHHSPICSCPPSYTGNPFAQCYPIPGKLKAQNDDRIPSLKLCKAEMCEFSSSQLKHHHYRHRLIRAYRRHADQTRIVRWSTIKHRVAVCLAILDNLRSADPSALVIQSALLS